MYQQMKNEVLVVGYSPDMIGGVTKVMNLLFDNIPFLKLHVALRYHRPKWKSRLLSLRSLGAFVVRLVFAAPQVVQVIVGSPGDAVRTLPHIIVARLRRCKVCLHFHKDIAAILDGFPMPVRRVLLSTWGLAHCCCFLSERLRSEFPLPERAPEQHVVIPNPISENWFRRPILPRRARTRDLVFLGRWCAEKGIDELLAALRGLNSGRTVSCDVFSDRSPNVRVENCTFYGWLEEDEVRHVLCHAKVLVLPSRAEAFPTVLLEAAACGTPFVASRIGGVPDIAEQSQAGLLHEVGDVDGMRDAVATLMTDEASWNRFSCNGRLWAESLQPSTIIQLWHRLYAHLGVKIR
jgi:glycosyltransferase involved in cell wall biosynthesis